MIQGIIQAICSRSFGEYEEDRVSSGGKAGRCGGVKQDLIRTELFVQQTSFPRNPQCIQNLSPGRLSRSVVVSQHAERVAAARYRVLERVSDWSGRLEQSCLAATSSQASALG